MDWLFVADLVRESFNQVNELLLFLLLLGTTLSIELSLSEKQATQSYLKSCFHFFNPEGLLEWLLPAFIEERVENLTENAAVEELLEIFNGDENNLIMTQTYTREFQCAYDFSRYPFDTQV